MIPAVLDALQIVDDYDLESVFIYQDFSEEEQEYIRAGFTMIHNTLKYNEDTPPLLTLSIFEDRMNAYAELNHYTSLIFEMAAMAVSFVICTLIDI